MKHTSRVTIILLLIFVASQLFGLFTLSSSIEITKNQTTGEVTNVEYSTPVIGERPELESSSAFIYIIFAVFMGTILILLLIRLKLRRVWKVWFAFAVAMTISTTFGVFINNVLIAVALGVVMALYKILKPNFYVQNISELFMYTGIAVIFVPLLNVFWMSMLLIVISIYDAYAVWKSKHMVKMANFMTESQVFAGLTIPYKKQKGKTSISMKIPKSQNYKVVESKERIALLGGGDIAFPLLFSGSVMQSLINGGLTKLSSFFIVQLITVFVTLALGLLFVYGKKDKFYPAMPFISTGAFIGFGLVYLVQYFI